MSLSSITPSTARRRLGDDQRCAARCAIAVDAAPGPRSGNVPPVVGARRPRSRRPRPCGSRGPSKIDAAHPGLRRERNERRADLLHVALPQAVCFLREHDDAAPFRRLVRQRRQLGGVGQLLRRHAGGRNERRRLPIAERDRAGLVEQQHVHVARGLDRAAGHGNHVRAIMRSIPAMPIADSSPPIVVGIRQTSSATSTVTVTGCPASPHRRCRSRTAAA